MMAKNTINRSKRQAERLREKSYSTEKADILNMRRVLKIEVGEPKSLWDANRQQNMNRQVKHNIKVALEYV